jgi:thiosulfate/3-mercaptopyruvate sulfurtransferase
VPYTTLVSTDTLAAHLDGSWAIVDCRYDLRNENWGLEQYRAAHIPGAVYASLSHDLAAPTGTNGRHPLPSAEQVAATFGRLGIGEGAQAVLYDQETGMFASRMWWMLRYMGHDAAAVLDGGWKKWTREGRPTRSGDETRPAATFTPRPRAGMRLDVRDIEAKVRDRSALLIDARGPERFEGQSEPLDRVAGHIPGAVNHHYTWNIASDGTMLPAETLRENFEKVLGDRAPGEAVMYCGSGVSACLNLLAMEVAGLRGTPLYPGSWSEWSSDPARAVETGPGKSHTPNPKPQIPNPKS